MNANISRREVHVQPKQNLATSMRFGQWGTGFMIHNPSERIVVLKASDSVYVRFNEDPHSDHPTYMAGSEYVDNYYFVEEILDPKTTEKVTIFL